MENVWELCNAIIFSHWHFQFLINKSVCRCSGPCGQYKKAEIYHDSRGGGLLSQNGEIYDLFPQGTNFRRRKTRRLPIANNHPKTFQESPPQSWAYYSQNERSWEAFWARGSAERIWVKISSWSGECSEHCPQKTQRIGQRFLPLILSVDIVSPGLQAPQRITPKIHAQISLHFHIFNQCVLFTPIFCLQGRSKNSHWQAWQKLGKADSWKCLLWPQFIPSCRYCSECRRGVVFDQGLFSRSGSRGFRGSSACWNL